MKRLSVMAPCYNGEKYVGRFLDSILEQTYEHIELIMINDGSTDATEAILTEYEERFKKRGYLYVHFYQENAGIGAALNNALKKVTGDYLTWFGSDDIACATYAEETVSFLEKNKEFAVLRCEGFIVDENNLDTPKGKFADANKDKHNPYLFENSIMERNFHFGYSVVRMDVFDKVNPRREIYPSRQGQNWQLLLPIFYRNKAAFYEKPLYYVVEDFNSVSRAPHKSYDKLVKQNEEYERILVNVLNSIDMPDIEKIKYFRMVKIKYIRRRLYAAVDYNQPIDAIKEYKELKKEKEVYWRDWLKYIRARFAFIDKVIRKIRRR